jgi:hypothetical protein
MTPSRASQHAPVLATVKAKPSGRPAAGLDSSCGPASDISGGNSSEGKTHKTTRSASRENQVSTKPGAVQTAGRLVVTSSRHGCPAAVNGSS